MVDASITLKALFLIRQETSDHKAKMDVRPVWPYWTNRRLINGVVDEPESLIGDARLDIVIEGVQDDIMVWLDAQDLSYTDWINLDTVPRALKRATTYAAVAALYARRTKTFQSRVIPSVTPVTVTVISEDEKSMNYWEDKSKEMLELYLSATEATRLWVSTADEEPVFTMDDIPEGQKYSSGSSDVPSWHEYILEQQD